MYDCHDDAVDDADDAADDVDPDKACLWWR